MLRAVSIPCRLPRAEADALNRASGEVYSRVVVTHWRVYRRTGHWLSPGAAERLDDYYAQDAERTLHAHSIDAAQQGFYKAVKTARTNRKGGKVQNAHFPHKRKFYRTTAWKSTGIRHRDGRMLLSRARGLEPVCVDFETDGTVREVRLVYDLKQHSYFWHVVVEDGITPTPVEGGTTAAIDMGEIHPVAITDGEEACVLSCRQLRSVAQGTNRAVASLQSKLSRTKRGSRRSKRLHHAKRRMLARQKRRQRDLLHKVSRATIAWCQERNVGTLAIGHIRDIADKTKEERRLHRTVRQKVSNWSHGTLRQYLGYKAEEAGIGVHDNVPEHHTSQTCPQCGHRHKPKGRTYRCTAQGCGFVFARDGVGAANILSRFLHGELGKVCPSEAKYRHPFLTGKRSPSDTRQVAAGTRQ
jgi:putative transposase